MRLFLAASLAASVAVTPVLADEFSETIELVLEAYEDGDINSAKEEMDYALQLLQEMQGAEFVHYLPEALSGWTRELGESDEAAAMAMFGGGVAATGVYSNGSDSFEITIMADNNIVASMGMMLSNTATMAMMGKLVRVNREKFVNADGEIQGMVGNVLIQTSGSASEDDVIAHLEEIDFKALEDY